MPDSRPRPPRCCRCPAIVKTFPGVRALDGVDLDVRAGEVHCLLGQNGAGKSTLIKVLAGRAPARRGHHHCGTASRPGSPRRMAAMQLGIATIYQELDLVDGLTVAENVFLGHERSSGGFVKAGDGRARRPPTLLRRLGHPEIPPGARGRPAVRRRQADRQHGPRAVARRPAHRHGRAVGGARRRRGRQAVPRHPRPHRRAASPSSTSPTGSRRSARSATGSPSSRTAARSPPACRRARRRPSELIRLMTGRSIEYVFPQRPAPGARAGRRRPSCSRSRACQPRRASSPTSRFDGARRRDRRARRAGRRRPLRGARDRLRRPPRHRAARSRVDGKRLRNGSVAAAVAAGIGLAPEERKSQALLLDQSIVPQHHACRRSPRFARAGFVRRGAERAARAASRPTALDVRPADVDRAVRTLSGGNQQKVVLGRWLLRGCRVLLLDEPTRGVDVGARSEIYALIRRLADSRRRRRRRVQRDRGGARPGRPRPRAAPTAASSTTVRPRRSTSTACSTSSWKEVRDERADPVTERSPGRRQPSTVPPGTQHAAARRAAAPPATAQPSALARALDSPVGRNLGLVIALAVLVRRRRRRPAVTASPASTTP